MDENITDSQLIEGLALSIANVAKEGSEKLSDDFDIYTKNLKAHFISNPQLFKVHFKQGFEVLCKGVEELSE